MNEIPRNLGRLNVPADIINLRHIGPSGLEQGLNSSYWAELGAAMAFCEVACWQTARINWIAMDENGLPVALTILVEVLEPGDGPAVAIVVPQGAAIMKSARRWCGRFLRVMNKQKKAA